MLTALKAITTRRIKGVVMKTLFKVAVAASKTQKVWKNIQVSWADIIEKIEHPIRTNETAAEYKAMSKTERDKKKDVGGFVGGYLKDGIRKQGHIVSRQLVCLDADNIPKNVDFPAVVDKVMKEKLSAYALYSTHSHTPEKPRFRLIIPLMREVSPEEYEFLSRTMAGWFGIDFFDPTTHQPMRLMYFPSAPKDGEYVSAHYERLKFGKDGEEGKYIYVNPDGIETSNPDWRDATTWLTGKNEAAAHKKTLQKLGDPREKPGLIGLFCQSYTIEEAIEKFLPDVYKKVDGVENRYTFAGGSTTGGFIIYDDGLHAYSHHATDPISGQDVNAFDLVRLNLFGVRDEDVEPNVPVNKRPSFISMTDLCQKDERVKALRNKDIEDALRDDLLEEGADGEKVNLDWIKKLERTKNTGKLLPTAHNMLLILGNDPRLKNKVGLDLFASRIAVLGDLPWRKHLKFRADIWTDADDSQLRNYISERYEGLQGRQIIDDAFTEVTQKNAFHPVRDWLEGLEWDGVPRVRRMLIDYLGAEDNPYTEEITEKFFKAAIARVYHPGAKFDFCLTISGPQGIGKSTLLAVLGGKWFNDTVTSIHGKDAMEQLQGYWIVELGEMQAATKAENNELKAFISRQNDKYRAPYGRRTEEHPRQCVFAATTNERIFLKDRTGGRRFWIVMCEGGKDIGEFTKAVADQCWAEVMEIWKKDKSLLPSPEILAKAKEIQEAHTEGAERLGLIQNYLDTELPEDWDNMTLGERQAWLEGDRSIGGDGVIPRERVCAMEIWCECFGNQPKNLKNIDAREINNMMQLIPGWEPYRGKNGKLRFKLYGLQRAFVKKSTVHGQKVLPISVTNSAAGVTNFTEVDIEDLM